MEKRSNVYSLRLTDREVALAREAARRSGTHPTDLMRKALEEKASAILAGSPVAPSSVPSTAPRPAPALKRGHVGQIGPDLLWSGAGGLRR